MNEKNLAKELAMGSILTGQISEVHILNMKMYPFVFFENLDTATVSYDVVTDPINALPGKKTTVCYTLEFKSKPLSETISEGHKNIKKALQALFSQEILLVLNDKDGRNLVQEDGR